MSKIYTSAADIIGRTPMLELRQIEKELKLHGKLIAKLEYLNPAGSVKDRVAKCMIDEAEKNGKIKPGSVIIEPTSGNTGIGLALVAASRGYKTIIVMPETMSIERRKILKAYGAELVLTEGTKGMAGAIEKANELAKEIPGSFIPSQFTNMDNPKAHYDTTGPEIFEDTEGNVDFFVSCIGTGGTITGTGRYLKEKILNVKIIGAEPEKSPVLTKGVSGSHKIQGIGAGFVPEVLDLKVCDQIMTVMDEDAFEMGRLLGKKEGILCGISSGAALWCAIQLARKQENSGKNIVVLLPDTGDRYLSTEMFEE